MENGNNMNQIMKVLTMSSILLAFPAIVAAYYGTNIALPMQHNPSIFWMTIAFGLIPGMFGFYLFRKLRWI